MLVLLAIVQAPRPISKGGAVADSALLDSFETVAEYRLREGWAPYFKDNRDPDQDKAWPYCSGFGAPWEPASAYLADQGLALNGPDGNSEVVIYNGIEWRHHRFDHLITSARLDPVGGNRLLVTLMIGDNNFETRLLELPRGRTIWTTCSGPWSRFSWDGQAVILGLFQNASQTSLLLSTIPAYDTPELSMPLLSNKGALSPCDDPIRQGSCLEDKSKKMLGVRLITSWQRGAKFWFPKKDCIWISVRNTWTMWKLSSRGQWRRVANGTGELYSQPPILMGLISRDKKFGGLARKVGPLNEIRWKCVSSTSEQWPPHDPAWLWHSKDSATTTCGLPWGKSELQKERQREALRRTNHSEWLASLKLRASVRGWLPDGPEVVLRESDEIAWVWVGHKVLMKELQPNSRSILIRKDLKG